MTPHQLHQRLLELRLTTQPYATFTSQDAKAAIEGYEGVIAGKWQGKTVNLEQAFALAYGVEMQEKQKRRRA